MSRRTPTLRDEILLALTRPKAEAADRILGIVEREKAEALAARVLRDIDYAEERDLRANQGGDVR